LPPGHELREPGQAVLALRLRVVSNDQNRKTCRAR
jgi:hypothetical protein